ncbi:unnamed protein product, partial [marine sediment metagenome]
LRSRINGIRNSPHANINVINHATAKPGPH